MIFASKIEKYQIFISFLLVFTLSSFTIGEVYFLDNDDKEISELNLIDEELKAETEKSEENSGRKHNENSLEFSGADGEFEPVSLNLNYFDQYKLPVSSYSYLYYPHINSSGLMYMCPPDFIKPSLLVLYHKFVFYDLILNLN